MVRTYIRQLSKEECPYFVVDRAFYSAENLRGRPRAEATPVRMDWRLATRCIEPDEVAQAHHGPYHGHGAGFAHLCAGRTQGIDVVVIQTPRGPAIGDQFDRLASLYPLPLGPSRGKILHRTFITAECRISPSGRKYPARLSSAWQSSSEKTGPRGSSPDGFL